MFPILPLETPPGGAGFSRESVEKRDVAVRSIPPYVYTSIAAELPPFTELHVDSRPSLAVTPRQAITPTGLSFQLSHVALIDHLWHMHSVRNRSANDIWSLGHVVTLETTLSVTQYDVCRWRSTGGDLTESGTNKKKCRIPYLGDGVLAYICIS